MKQAISYIRISNKDQSNFSLSGQQDYIKQFCERKGIAIINTFLDNGQSAKNFERADWKKLEDFVKKHYKDIDYLVVAKYDRFSRDVSDGLAMLNKLEKKYGIVILSVFEELHIDPKSPFFFKMRTDMLVMAEFELRVIRDRTKLGLDQAKREGRWANRAPIGYDNVKEDGKPGIKINPEKSLIVKEIFKTYLGGASLIETKRMAEKLGYSQSNRSAIKRILQNPAYVGMLKLNGDLVKGKHEPIIDLLTFNRVQETFRKETQIKVVVNDEVPLRGVLRCSCGKLLTAGKSKGKTKYYWYYKCMAHLEVNLNSNKVHEQLRNVLFDLSLSEQTIDKIRKRADIILKETVDKQDGSVSGVKKRISELETKIASLEEKFISNQIDFKVYSNWNSAYNTELNQQRNELKALTQKKGNIWEIYREESLKLTDLRDTYDGMSTLSKQRLLNSVFKHSLMYRLNSFLTSNIIEIFQPNALKLKEKGLLLLNNPSQTSDEVTICTGNGTILELFEVLKSA